VSQDRFEPLKSAELEKSKVAALTQLNSTQEASLFGKYSPNQNEMRANYHFIDADFGWGWSSKGKWGIIQIKWIWWSFLLQQAIDFQLGPIQYLQICEPMPLL
jgi:hypothetical protein